MKLVKVISGGQTGADSGGLLAARACNIRTGGFAPKGWLTEVGPRPGLARYGLVEHPSEKYPPRTAANIKHSHATLIIAASLDRGSLLTANMCKQMHKFMLHISSDDLQDISTQEKVVVWLLGLMRKVDITLNVAGNRESRSPGIQRATKVFLTRVFSDVPH